MSVQDPNSFIATLKEKQQNNEISLDKDKFNSTYKTNKEFLDEEDLYLKLGSFETKLKIYTEQIKGEVKERNILEKRFDRKIESLNKELGDIKTALNSMGQLFNDGFAKVKSALLERIELGNNSTNSVIAEMNKKINNLEGIVSNKKPIYTKVDNKSNNSILLSSDKKTDDSSIIAFHNSQDPLIKRVNQLESVIYKNTNIVGREQEINTGLAKINFLENKFDHFIDNYNENMDKIDKNIKNNISDIKNLINFKDIINDKIENLHQDFNESSVNTSKFQYQTTMLLNETQRKIDEYTVFYNKTRNEIESFKSDITNTNIALRNDLGNTITIFESFAKNLENKLIEDQKAFQINLGSENEKFIKYIETKVNGQLNKSEEIQKMSEEEIKKIKDKNNIINKELNEVKNTFFHNLNEIEEYFNKKYESICRIINMSENNSCETKSIRNKIEI